MKQIQTASEMLAYIEKNFFRGAGLAKAGLLKGEERRAYVLAQVERLLTEMYGSLTLAVYLSDMFWTADEGRTINKHSPLATPAGQQTLTDKERERLRLIMEVAALCHDLILHFKFDLKEALGIRNSFWVSNKRLVEWLTTAKHERIAMHTAYIMKKNAINVFEYSRYLPAQDSLADLFSSEYHCLVGRPESTKMPSRDYVRAILDELLRIERHWQRGRRRKLEPEVVILHDEIFGVMPFQFDSGVLEVAQALYDYMDREVYGRLIGADKDTANKVLRGFVDKVCKLRDQHLAKGWLTNDSLAFSYLVAHAEMCGHGWWREEEGDL